MLVKTQVMITYHLGNHLTIFSFRTYGGFTNDRVTQQEHNNLYASLSEDDKVVVDPNGTYFYAGYDPPFKLFFRRNEIWMFHKAEGELASQRMEISSDAQQTECTTSS